MRIVILGADTIGMSIANQLCKERHEVVVVDIDSHKTKLANELDVGVVTGNASEVSVLFQTRMSGADLCLAVTGNDEANIVAASLAKAMGARRALARVYTPVFRDLSTFDYQQHFNIDRLLSIEQLTALELAREIRHAGSVTVENFVHGELEVQELMVEKNVTMVGKPLHELNFPSNVRLGSILREGQLKIAVADDVLMEGDRITLIGRRNDIDEVQKKFHRSTVAKQYVIILGGGETGLNLARILEMGPFEVKIIEENPERCQYLSKVLEASTTVACRDSHRENWFAEENVGHADVFVGCMKDDEDSIMACVEAKELGAKKVMSVVSRPDYANVIGKLGIDHMASPRLVFAKEVVAFLNEGVVISRWPLHQGSQVNVLEMEVEEGAYATEEKLRDLQLPSKALIGAFNREGYVMVPGGDSKFRAGDTVVALVHQSCEEEAIQVFAKKR